jgi:serine/threonine protein kinase
LSLELEYIGPDLARSINEKDISQLSTAAQHRIWIDISRGLQHIHSIGIIHLDVKPQNILLGKDDRAVLCDFELSVEGTVETKNNGGTPPYLPPEYLYDGRRGMSGDIYAFGVTMLFVFGLIPLPRGSWRIEAIHRDPNVQAKMVDWLKEVQQVAEDVPDSLLLLRQMLDGNSKKRITAQQMVEDLTALESHNLEPAPEVLVPLLC